MPAPLGPGAGTQLQNSRCAVHGRWVGGDGGWWGGGLPQRGPIEQLG